MKLLNFVFFAILFISISNSLAEPVLDIDGEELKPGSSYYVMSAIWGAGGGGLTLSNYRNKPCPTTVSQEASDLRRGLPVIFSPVDSEEDVISLSSGVNIKFDVIPPCAESSVWQMGGLDPYTRSILLEIGGKEGPENSFKIEKGSYSFSYQISDSSGDNYLSIRSALGERPVAVMPSDSPFQVVFIKADDTSGNGHQGILAMKV